MLEKGIETNKSHIEHLIFKHKKQMSEGNLPLPDHFHPHFLFHYSPEN